MATLEARNLKKTYRKRAVVRDVSIRVESGQTIGLLGPNGAGKTTSFYMLVGLVRPDAGKVFLDEKDITLAPMHQRARAGLSYLPQEASIFRKLTVAENILAILQLRKDLTAEARKQALNELLQEFHIDHLRDQEAMSLSGGERRRVEIARALATNPHFILLDEPFAGIDPISVLDIKRIIEHLCQRGIGVLITDHNVRETLTICQHAYIVSGGEIIAAGDAAAIMANQKVREVYLGEEFDL